MLASRSKQPRNSGVYLCQTCGAKLAHEMTNNSPWRWAELRQLREEAINISPAPGFGSAGRSAFDAVVQLSRQEN